MLWSSSAPPNLLRPRWTCLAHCVPLFITACAMVGCMACLSAVPAQAQDSTATAQRFVVLSPMAQAALYQPGASAHYQGPECRPGNQFTSRERCIAKGIFFTVMGAGLVVGGAALFYVALASKEANPLVDTVVSIFATPPFLGGIIVIIYGIKLIKRGKKLPPGPPLHPRPRPF